MSACECECDYCLYDGRVDQDHTCQHRAWEHEEKPTWSKPCTSCGETVERWRGQGDVSCRCGAEYNVSGQRLRDDWRGNPSCYDDDIDDLEGYEMQHAGDE